MPRLALALALALSAAAAPRLADACGNSIRRVVDSDVRAVQSAELMLAQGNYAQAISVLRLEFGDRGLVFDKTRRPVGARAQRILAVAVARTRGATPIGMDLGGPSEAKRQAAVAWAVLTLRIQHTGAAGSDPVRTTELAEALALQPSGRAEALGLLQDLATRDLVPSAEGWALLGELTRERGDMDASRKAVERCKQIATDGVKCDTAENS